MSESNKTMLLAESVHEHNAVIESLNLGKVRLMGRLVKHLASYRAEVDRT